MTHTLSAEWFALKNLRGPRRALHGRPITRATRPPLRLEPLEDRLAPASLSGTVFEDINYGGGAGRSLAASSGVGRPGAAVELYDAAGNFLTATTTNANGVYTFSGLADGAAYSVRVVDSTVASSRPGNSAGLLPVQTFQTDASSGTVVPVTTDVGGAVPSAQDSGAKGPGGNLNDAAVEESVTRVQVGTGVASVTGLNFGFNFDAIVNTNATGQGSLAQFILNSNALGNTGLAQVGQSPGVEASIFMIPSTADPLGRPADPNFSGGVAVIRPFPDLPAISDSFTHIDGATQTANIGDTNPGVAGTGGTVGVDNLTLDTVNRPEVEIIGLGNFNQGFGLTVAANDDAIRGIAIRGFSFNLFIMPGSQRTTIESNLVGLTPTGARPTDQPDGGGENVFSNGGIDGVVRNNILAFGGSHGVILNTGSTGWVVEDNEIRSNGLVVKTLDGVEFNNGSTGNTLEGNLLIDNQANGVDLLTASGANTITENTITHNGFDGVEEDGILVRNSGTTITLNVISDNYGAGVAVTAQASDILISRNSIFANGTEASPGVGPATGEIGIDLLTPTDPVTGTPPFVTPNHPGGGASGGNGLLNFPVLTTATLTGGDLELDGFARPGSVIELFVADPDPSGFGEGKTYLITLTEGPAQDLDSGTGSYGPGPINGLSQGSDTTNRFRFLIPVASLPAPVGMGTVLTATATLGDPSTSEFSGNVTVVRSPQADLRVVKTVSDAAPLVGSAVIFTVALTDLGPDAATNVTVQDRLPAGLSFISATPSQGAYDPGSGLWVVGTVPAGATPTLRITAAVVSPGPETNTAGVAHSDQFDPDTSNNASSASVAPLLPPPPVIGKVGLLGSRVAPDGTFLDPASDAAFVERLYFGILGRAPDAAGFAALTAALQQGISRAAAAAAVWNSPGHLGQEAALLYQQILHRPIDHGGLAASVAYLMSGGGEGGLAWLLLTSAEYTASHPDAASFVNGLYQDVLGRGADPSGMATFTGLLQSGVSRSTVAADLLNSPEALGDVVNRLYLEILGRPADPLGEQLDVAALGRGLSEDALAQILMTSDEFFAREA
jgi:uncharacterized repeat protein (TIGR01451 family)